MEPDTTRTTETISTGVDRPEIVGARSDRDATIEINRGMKGEYSIRVVCRDDLDDQALERAIAQLRFAELRLGIVADWHAGYDAMQAMMHNLDGPDEFSDLGPDL